MGSCPDTDIDPNFVKATNSSLLSFSGFFIIRSSVNEEKCRSFLFGSKVTIIKFEHNETLPLNSRKFRKTLLS